MTVYITLELEISQLFHADPDDCVTEILVNKTHICVDGLLLIVLQLADVSVKKFQNYCLRAKL